MAVAASLAAGTAAIAQTEYEWAMPLDGRFDVESNWLPTGVPGPGDRATLGGDGPYVVTIAGVPMGSPLPFPQVDVLDLSNPQAVALLAKNRRFRLGELLGAGEFWLQPPDRGEDTTLFVDGGGVVAGTLRLRRDSGASQRSRIANDDPSLPVRITSSGRVTGGGWIDGWFENHGVIEANGDDPRLLLSGRIVQSTDGVIRGVDSDATVAISTLSPTSIEGGRLELPEGGIFSPNGSYLTGIAIGTAAGASVSLDALNTTLLDCTLEGLWGMREGRRFTVEGSLTGDATIVVNDNKGTAATTIQLFGDASLGIRVVLNSATTAGLGQFRDGVATILPQGVVTGWGGLYGRIHNEGVIEAPGPDGFISFSPDAVISQADGGEIRSTGGTISLTSAELRGGRWVAGHGDHAGTLKGGTVSDATFKGRWKIVAGTSAVIGGRIGADANDPGVLMVNSASLDRLTILWVEPRSALDAIVELSAPDSGDTSAASLRTRGVGEPITIGPTGVVRGRGLIRFGDFVLQGTLSPNGEGGPSRPGVIEVADATLACHPDSRLIVDVAGPDAALHDRVAGNAMLELDGTLEVRFADGYEPEPSDRYEFLLATSLTGRFSSIQVEHAAAVQAAGPAHVVYAEDTATLVLCAADRTGDGVVDAFDFLAFQAEFAEGESSADLDGDGRLTIFDFLAFQDRFVRGC